MGAPGGQLLRQPGAGGGPVLSLDRPGRKGLAQDCPAGHAEDQEAAALRQAGRTWRGPQCNGWRPPPPDDGPSGGTTDGSAGLVHYSAWTTDGSAGLVD